MATPTQQSAHAARSATGRSRPLAAACVLLLALNLRPVVNAVGAVVPQMRADTGLSATATGLLLSLPMIAFALLGVAGPALTARFGPHRTVVVTLVLLTAGQLVRAAVPGTWALFAGSLIALAGIAVGNVVLPGLIRLHFADRIPLMTSAYTTTLAVGAAAAVALSNPIEHALKGTWRTGLGIWAAVALVALVPWAALTRGSAARTARTSGTRLPLRTVARTRIAWWLALYFGLQAMLAYVIMGWLPEILTGRGMSQTGAAFQVAIIIVVGIPPAALVSSLLGRVRRPELLVIALSGCYVAGLIGLIVLRGAEVVVSLILIGIGTAAFPVALTLIAQRSRTALATTSLSAFTQCIGYVVAAVGPVAFGALYEIVGSWTAPLLTLAAVAVAQAVFGTLTVRAGYVEDELLPVARTSDGVGVGLSPSPDDEPGQRRDRHATHHSE
jgi:CP family cyanate transporter-like MFS transporter